MKGILVGLVFLEVLCQSLVLRLFLPQPLEVRQELLLDQLRRPGEVADEHV